MDHPASLSGDSPQGYTVSKLFCEHSADIAFASSDNVLFKLHKTHLSTTSKILAVTEGTVIGSDIVHLPEPAEVLEILFQFIEPPPTSRNNQQPSVLDMEAGLVFRLAEAAEKYVVYGAMNVCLTRMSDLMFNHPFDVLNHCAKHGYAMVANNAAKKTLEQSDSLSMAVSKLTAVDILPKWVLLYSEWRKAAIAAGKVFEKNLKSDSPCHIWPHLYASYLNDLNRFPLMISATPSAPNNKVPCTIARCTCRSFGSDTPWFAGIKSLVATIPEFSDIML